MSWKRVKNVLCFMALALLAVQANASYVTLNPKYCLHASNYEFDSCIVEGDTGYACDDPFSNPGHSPNCTPSSAGGCVYTNSNENRSYGVTRTGLQDVYNPVETDVVDVLGIPGNIYSTCLPSPG